MRLDELAGVGVEFAAKARRAELGEAFLRLLGNGIFCETYGAFRILREVRTRGKDLLLWTAI